jgi:hypothetical protein
MSVEDGTRVNALHTTITERRTRAPLPAECYIAFFTGGGAGQGRTRQDKTGQDRVGQSGPVACLPKHNRRVVIGRQGQKAHTESFLPLG